MTYFLQQAISFRYSSATIQNKIFLGQYIPNIIKYQIITQLSGDIHLKSINLLINPAKYKKQYSPSCATIIAVTSRPQHQTFTLAPPTHTLSSFPIGCHAPTTNFPACSLVLEFSNSLSIHHDYLLFNIFVLISLTCSSCQ